MDDERVKDLLAQLQLRKPPDETLVNTIAEELQRTSAIYLSERPKTFPCAKLKVDESAKFLLPNSLPAVSKDSLVPAAVYGDGNCLFRAASLFRFGTEAVHLELRLATLVELHARARYYAEDFVKRAEEVANSTEHAMCANSLLSSILSDVGDEEFRRSQQSETSLFDKSDAFTRAIRADVAERTPPGKYSSLLYLAPLATVLGARLHSVYPERNGKIRAFYHTIFTPRCSPVVHLESAQKQAGCHPLSRECFLLWTAIGFHAKEAKDAWWTPNYFVPLLPMADTDLQSLPQSQQDPEPSKKRNH